MLASDPLAALPNSKLELESDSAYSLPASNKRQKMMISSASEVAVRAHYRGATHRSSTHSN
jgi:hypothetical protein